MWGTRSLFSVHCCCCQLKFQNFKSTITCTPLNSTASPSALRSALVRFPRRTCSIMWPCKSNTQFLPAILPKPHSNAIRNPGALASGVRAPPNTKERTILYDGGARTCSPTVHEHATATASSSPASRRWLVPSSEITICQEFRHMGPTIRVGTKSSSIAAAYAVRTESRPSVRAKAGANTRQLALARWLVPKSHTHTHIEADIGQQ